MQSQNIQFVAVERLGKRLLGKGVKSRTSITLLVLNVCCLSSPISWLYMVTWSRDFAARSWRTRRRSCSAHPGPWRRRSDAQTRCSTKCFRSRWPISCEMARRWTQVSSAGSLWCGSGEIHTRGPETQDKLPSLPDASGGRVADQLQKW